MLATPARSARLYLTNYHISPGKEVCITVQREILKSKKYENNVTFLKVYGNKKIKVSTMGSVRISGVEDERETRILGVNSSKLDDNVTRARSAILEISMCNQWDVFCTLTFDKANVNRMDLDSCYKALQLLIRSQREQFSNRVEYVLIPEQHQDGAWHFHGFLRGCGNGLQPFSLSDKPPKYVREKLSMGKTVYRWVPAQQRLGWTICEPISNPEAAARYVTKYITKDLSRSVSALGAHLYYCSKGLQRSETIKKGHLAGSLLNVQYVPTGTYEGEYCTTRWYDYSPELLEQLRTLIL